MGMHKHTNKRVAAGFTIIEVLIVLAIAGLIVTLCLMAVGAVQRNQRNAARRSDANIVSTQRLIYDREIQTTFSGPPSGYMCTSPITSKIYCQYIDKLLAHYALGNVEFHFNGTTKPTTAPVMTNPDRVRTDTHLRCAANGKDAEPSNFPQDMVVIFLIETGNGFQQQCVQGNVTSSS